jgi:predicted Zn-dependent peptidase
MCLALALLTAAGMGCRSRADVRSGADTLSLKNGIRVVVVRIPGTSNTSIFTYLPMGLASDGAGQAQWSHLVEHLVLRTTVPFGSQEANAETLPDHLRLDFYGTTENWEDGLSHHVRWLEGVPFAEQSLTAEKPRVNAECDTVAQSLATHKFAMAAWAQGYRFGRPHAAIKGDVERATLADIQRYRDERLPVLEKVVVCIVGGLDAETVTPVVIEQLGKLTSEAKLPAPVAATGGSREMTWDLAARHLVLTWPVPDLTAPDYPALMVAGQWLTMQLFGDQELKALTGMAFAGADLTTPEGRFFYVSASVRPEASFQAVQAKLDTHLAALRTNEPGPAEAPQIGRQLSDALTTIPDVAMVKAQAPPNMTEAMIEGNLGLQYGMHQYRYGSHRTAIADGLAAVTAADVRQAAQEHLAPERCSLCTLRPESPT